MVERCPCSEAILIHICHPTFSLALLRQIFNLLILKDPDFEFLKIGDGLKSEAFNLLDSLVVIQGIRALCHLSSSSTGLLLTLPLPPRKLRVS